MNTNGVVNGNDSIAMAEAVIRKLGQEKLPIKQEPIVVQDLTSENEAHDLGWASSALLHIKGLE